MANPDFTQGEKIPSGANHDWTLGATGARGWMFSDKLVTTDARQIAITEVEKDSPADDPGRWQPRRRAPQIGPINAPEIDLVLAHRPLPSRS